jgi:hypothetical protein
MRPGEAHFIKRRIFGIQLIGLVLCKISRRYIIADLARP